MYLWSPRDSQVFYSAHIAHSLFKAMVEVSWITPDCAMLVGFLYVAMEDEVDKNSATTSILKLAMGVRLAVPLKVGGCV